MLKSSPKIMKCSHSHDKRQTTLSISVQTFVLLNPLSDSMHFSNARVVEPTIDIKNRIKTKLWYEKYLLVESIDNVCEKFLDEGMKCVVTNFLK